MSYLRPDNIEYAVGRRFVFTVGLSRNAKTVEVPPYVHTVNGRRTAKMGVGARQYAPIKRINQSAKIAKDLPCATMGNKSLSVKTVEGLRSVSTIKDGAIAKTVAVGHCANRTEEIKIGAKIVQGIIIVSINGYGRNARIVNLNCCLCLHLFLCPLQDRLYPAIIMARIL